MKHLLTWFLLFVAISSYGQLVDSLWFFFEDAVGNRDSVLYGGVYEGDPIPDHYKNSEFNLFNEEFAVGIAKFFPHENIEPNDLLLCKYVIDTYSRVNQFSSYNQLYIRLKHPPLKVYYDSKFFYELVKQGAYMTSDYRVELLFPNNFDLINRFECLYGQDTLIWELGTEFMQLDRLPMIKLANLSNGTVDTIWGLRHSDLYWYKQEFGTPCPFPVSTDDPFTSHNIEVINNGNSLSIYNNSNQEIDRLMLTLVSGQRTLQLSRSIYSRQEHHWDIQNLPTGIYLLSAHLKSGENLVLKLKV